MTPESRKAVSEQTIRTLGLPVYEHLPLVESEADINLRSSEEVLQRLIALWAVAGTAMLSGNAYFREYIVESKLQRWLSKRELEFLLAEKPNENQRTQFSWQLESLYFVAWCAGLVECAGVPTEESSVKQIMDLFPQEKEPPDRLRSTIRLRGKSEILDQVDLLYRLHWAVRNSRLSKTDRVLEVNGGVVQEWHRAANWMVRYDDEDNWDYVATDT